MKKQNVKAKRMRLLIFGSISVLAIFYFIYSFTKDTLNIKNLKQEEITLKTNLNDLKEKAENLKVEIEKLKDPEYIARFVRERYFYSKETGEYIIQLNEKEEVEKEKVDKKDNTSMYFIVGIGIVLLIIIVYIIKKR